MKAAVRDHYGSIDVVRIDELEKPEPTRDELLVRVAAASVNRADLDSLGPRPGFARAFMGLTRPKVTRMGIDVAGVVEAAGPEASAYRPGDRVFADLFSFGSGAFGEYVAASEKAFARIPDDLSFEDAATLPHSSVLALQGLRLRSGRTIQAGDLVLIDGASGNVGPFAVQIAKSMGAEVTGVCRTEKLDFVRSLGADHVIDYRAMDYTRTGRRYDWIVDTDSHHSPLAVRRALRAGGVYVTLGGTSLPIFAAMLTAPVIGRATGHSMGLLLWWKPFHRPDVDRILELVAAGQVRPAIDRRFPLSELADALRWVDEGHAKGKVIVTPDRAG
jgi:NADPH:quinone reductase-like Zn-dependent oxidoreductase